MRPHDHRRLALALAALGVACVVGGCRVYSSMTFDPRPAEAHVGMAGSPGSIDARALVTIRRVNDPDLGAGRPATVDVRVLVENTAGKRVRVDPMTMKLFSAGLQAFGPPRLEPYEPVEIEPFQSVTLDAGFPFPDHVPPGDVDLSGLRLQWAIEIDDATAPVGVTFTRRQATRYREPPPYYHRPPYW